MTQQNADIQSIYRLLSGFNRTLMRTRQKVYALQAEAELRRAGREPRMPVSFQSQNGEDLMVWDLLGGPLDGFFIEAGAFDGYHYSVTYALEAVGWNGLLVEALAEPAKQCAARRPNSRVVHSALGKEASGNITFNVVQDQYGGMLSHVSGFGQVASPQGTIMTPVQVPLTNLNMLLKDHDGPIDLLVLDVEAAEFAVLEGFDINRFRPRMMMIETDPTRDKQRLIQSMQAFPYRYIGNIESNEMFIRNDQTEVFDRIKWLLM